MTTTADAEVRLVFTERLAVAIGRGWARKGDLAEFLEVSPVTVSRWVSGEVMPRATTLRVIAAESGVPYEWLKPSPEESGKGFGQYAPRDSNPEPADVETCQVIALLSEADAILRAAVTA